MKKILLVLFIIGLFFSGCGINDKTTIKLNCIDGKIYVDIYKATFVDSEENIELKKYQKRDKSLYFNDDGTNVKCINN